MVDECGEDFLPGHAGDPQPIGRFSLPDVEGSVCGSRQVDGPSCPLGACPLVACGLVA